MDKDTAIKEIIKRKPKIIYVSGKTCTGKTTLADEVASRGYAKIELDDIVNDSVVIPFNISAVDEAFITAYCDTGPAEQVAAFIAAAQNEITKKLSPPGIVIEGAIAKSRILKEIFSGKLSDFFFVYLHPVDLESYKEKIRTRFVAGAADKTSGLPKFFWNFVQNSDFEQFIKTNHLNEGLERSIGEYAIISMQESKERLRHFKENFSNILVIEV